VNDLKSSPISLERGDEFMAARKKGSVSKEKRYPWLKLPTPTLKALQVYAFDPSTGGYTGNSTTVHVPWEKLAPGPSGCKIGVVATSAIIHPSTSTTRSCWRTTVSILRSL
jgi:hypothetical protein